MANLRPQPPRNQQNTRTQKPGELPSAHITGDDSDDDPDTGLGDRPWTRVELRDRAQAMIQRRKRKQHGKLMGDEKQRSETVDEIAIPDSARGAPPAKEYAASSVASKESNKEPESTMSKSSSMKQAGDIPGEGQQGDGDRPENWWRGAGKEKGR